MHCEVKLKLRSHNTSYCLIEVVTKAGLTVYDLEVSKCFNVIYSSTDVFLVIATWPSYKTDCKLKISSCWFSLDRITTVSSGSPWHLNNRAVGLV